MKSPSDLPADSTQDRRHALVQALRRRILTMQIAPGAVLDEYALADEFGLSRPPVREVMRQMAGEGYIELEPNRPARAAAMGHQSLRDFFLFAPLVFVASTRLAAERHSRAELDGLKEIQRQFRAAIAAGDVEARVFENDRFHLRIGEMAHNAYVLPSLRRCQIDHARIAMTFYADHGTAQSPRRMMERDEAAQQHDEIIDAIAARDPDTAEALVRAHLELSRRNMASYAAPASMNLRIVS